jgi:Kdo-III transferase WaaZ
MSDQNIKISLERSISINGITKVHIAPFSEIKSTQHGEVFLIASGPSAGEFNFKDFCLDKPVIAMNGSISLCESNNIKPFFYICYDEFFVGDRLELFMKGVNSAENLAFSYQVIEEILKRCPDALMNKKVFLFERVNRDIYDNRIIPNWLHPLVARARKEAACEFSLLGRKKSGIGFSLDLSKGYYGGRTILFGGLQLAHHIGFNKVFTIGMDMNSSAGRFYEKGEGSTPSNLDIHWQRNILPSFKLMAKSVIKKGTFEVFNLSEKSRVPHKIIPKISLTELRKMLQASEI